MSNLPAWTQKELDAYLGKAKEKRMAKYTTQTEYRNRKAGSFNGKTPPFDGGDLGSNPRPVTKSKYEFMSEVFKSAGIPEPTYEFRFHDTRRWRMDMAWRKQKVYCEVQGGIFIKGRHTRGASLLKEWEKLNTASSMGWRVLFVQPSDIAKPEFIDIVKRTLAL